jgi:hypothetical protein
MLDTVHKVMLRAVANGTAPVDPPPALRRLEATGLVVQVDGRWAVTEAGNVALSFDAEGGGGTDLKTKLTAWFTT